MNNPRTRDLVLLGETASMTTPQSAPTTTEIDDFVRHMECRGYRVACRLHIDHDANLASSKASSNARQCICAHQGGFLIAFFDEFKRIFDVYKYGEGRRNGNNDNENVDSRDGKYVSTV